MSVALSGQPSWNGCPRMNSQLGGLVDHVVLCPSPWACLNLLGHPSIPAGIRDRPQGQDGVSRGEVETCMPASLFPSPASCWMSRPDNSPLESPSSLCGTPLHLVSVLFSSGRGEDMTPLPISQDHSRDVFNVVSLSWFCWVWSILHWGLGTKQELGLLSFWSS